MVSDSQYQQLLARTTKLEEAVNDIFVAMHKLITLGEVNQLLVITQTDIDDLSTRVDSLETRVSTIEQEPI